MLDPSPVLELLSTLHVAKLASQAEVTPATVRYYSRIGLLRPSRDPENGYRCFVATDLRRVVFIRQAQTLGLTIGDIRAILETVDQGEAPCHQVKSLVQQRLAGIRVQIAGLQATEAYISKALTSWNDMDDQVRTNGELCPLIERAGNTWSADERER
jgi:MerR family transcriptional regulator, Zn(II)-responsive regulator of zntA